MILWLSYYFLLFGGVNIYIHELHSFSTIRVIVAPKAASLRRTIAKLHSSLRLWRRPLLALGLQLAVATP